MLKIYLKTIIQEVHSGNTGYEIYHRSFYDIEEESLAKTHTRQCSVYHDEINRISCHVDLFDTRRGRIAYVIGDGSYLKFKQWKEPNVVLVERISYKEHVCSMQELFRINADKVIAYLNQEGMNITMPS